MKPLNVNQFMQFFFVLLLFSFIFLLHFACTAD